ncbi:MAG TPA: hypothetical protein VIJ22_14695, partial [Polyangiaceae bacterium]
MTAVPEEGDERRALRFVLAGVAALEMVVLTQRVLARAAEARLRGAQEPPLVAWLSWAPVVVVVAAIGLVALTYFARRRARLGAGVVGLVALATLEHTHAALFIAGHQRAYFAVGSMLVGWFVGLLFARALPTSSARRLVPDETLAEAGALAGLAATYVDSGLSKLTKAGWMWTDATTLRSAILSNHDVDDTSPLASFARFVVEHDAVARAFSVATIVVQLGAVLYVLGPRLRMLWGTLLLAFHVNVALTTQILYLYNCILLLAFSFPWARILRRKTTAPPRPVVVAPDQTRRAALAVAPWIVLAVAV